MILGFTQKKKKNLILGVCPSAHVMQMLINKRKIKNKND